MTIRECWYRRCKPGTTLVASGWLLGNFQQFAQDHIEYDCGPGMIPVAIIIEEDGMVCVTSAEQVCFGETKPA